SAYRSLRTNLPYLFTYQKHPDLNIPNTTNSLDGCFAYLKAIVKVHRGSKKNLKRKIIEEILWK
ncbi:MAG: transposase, partial [Bacteroidia bacterium]|nr:transposase [Bacteroidia bacterium]